MRGQVDPGLLEFCGSEARLLALGVLANAERPMTGYRVAKVAELPPIKVYEQLARGVKVGIVRKTGRGYVLADTDLRTLLQKRVRLFWAVDWNLREPARAEKSRQVAAEDDSWFDRRNYTPNPAVAARYAREFERPPEKGPSRKSR